MKLSLSKVIVGIVILTIFLFLCLYLLPLTVIRVTLGIPFLLFFPGFVLMAAIAPKKNNIDITERLVLSFVLSIVIDALIGLVLHYTWFGITFSSASISVAIFVELVAVLCLVRQTMLRGDEQVVLEFNLQFIHSGSGIQSITFTIIMTLVLTGAVAIGLYFCITPKSSETFTQFYIIKQDGGALYSPTNIKPGDEISIILGITNHEASQTSYKVYVLINGESFTQTDFIILDDGEQWQEKLNLSVDSGVEKQIEFILYKNSGTEPYLKPLRLQIDTMELEIAY